VALPFASFLNNSALKRRPGLRFRVRHVNTLTRHQKSGASLRRARQAVITPAVMRDMRQAFGILDASMARQSLAASRLTRAAFASLSVSRQ
jgi:hypothetical protein